MTNETNPRRIIWKGKIVEPKMAEPPLYLPPEGKRWAAYYDHLNSLSDIECSAELLERFKDGDTVEEGKDYVVDKVVTGGRSVKSAEGTPYDYHTYYKLVAVPIPTDAVEEGEEITEHEMSWLLRLREYFGENDKTQFEHSAYHFLDNLIKKLNQSQYKLIKK